MNNHYRNVIDILTTKQDWKEICIKIGKTHPEILCEAAGFYDIDHKIMEIVRAKGKVTAIKYLRDLKNLDLKSAKDKVDQIVTAYMSKTNEDPFMERLKN